MTKYRTLTAALALAVITVGFTLPSEPEHPNHPAPAAAPVPGSPPLAAVGGGSSAEIESWIEGVNEGAWYEGVEEALADLARQRPVRGPVGVHGAGDCAALAVELGLPESVLWRESRCSTDAYNATGCGGRGCIGAAQLDRGHFAPVSPWNSNTSGSCADLDPNDPAQYAECVHRLPDSAWG